MWIESTLPLETGFVRIPESLRLRFRRMGDGPVILLLHGWPQSGHAWRHVLPTLATSGYTVVAPDLRGAGESDKPTGGYDAATRMEDVRALLAALELTDEPLFVVGHGDGGAEVASAFASVHPEEMSGVAVLSAPPHSGDVSDWHVGFHQTPDLPETLIGPHLETYLRHFLRSWAHDPGVFSEADIQVYAQTLTAPGALRASLAPFRAERQPTSDDSSVVVPRLFLLGESDPRFTPGQLAQAQQAEPNLQVIPRAGHWLAEERPDAVATALLTFFESLKAAP